MSDITPAASYLDFGSLTALRGQAAQNEGRALRKVAEQFESHFIQETMKAMRQTVVKSELSESASTDLYEDLMDKEIAQQMSRRGGVGMVDMLERQFLLRNAQPVPSTQDALKSRALPLQPAAVALPLAAPTAAPLALPRAGGYALPGAAPLALPK